MRRAQSLYLALALALAVPSSFSACSDDKISGFGSLGGTKSKKSKEITSKDKGFKDEDGDGIHDDDGDAAKTKSIDNSGANFQVKDVVLLRNSIEACMGKGMTLISADMLLQKQEPAGGTPPAAGLALLADGTFGEAEADARALAKDDLDPLGAFALAQEESDKFAFLLPTPQVEAALDAGTDIIEIERGNLVDLKNATRTTVAGDSVTDTYLRSLETVANVVGHNCALDKKECDCSTKKKSRSILVRCLPALDPETKEFDFMAKRMSTFCSKGPSGMRTAISSMIASYAFAAAR